jgi:flavin-dependent dehydrogenase
MSVEYDVLVVGARCAGSSLATPLARSGLRVCLVDRAHFPSDTPSTHFIQPIGVRVLERLGVLERLLELAPPVDAIRLRFGELTVEEAGGVRRLGAPGICVRRQTLDAVLLEAAANAGADVRTGTPVVQLVEADGRVIGVSTARGEIRARLVVGADGATSTVASLVGAREYDVTQPTRMFLWGYFDGARLPAGPAAIWLGKIGATGYLGCPTDGGLYMAGVTIDYDKRREVLADRDRCFRERLSSWPELNDIVRDADLVAPLRAMTKWRGFLRESAGPGWALVGDAGHFKDPTPGQGIADALRQSSRLADVIVAALPRGSARLDAALREWWLWRDKDAWDMYWFAQDLGAAGKTALVVRQIQRHLVRNPKLTERFVRIINHEANPASLVSNSLALRAVSASLLRHPREWRAIVREAREIVSDQSSRARAFDRVEQLHQAGSAPPATAAHATTSV